ncbi:ABC transporter permease [Pontixanthobacter aestiaquae]|uniref:ABC transporter permease n=1 Tax=Pontixanthobacter aestiaquae TaxID=1509367 RepID=A0A844Z5Z7_9SPHN|nr:ABC transporter permease [Pontixanthobacter aestiaquae]MDN3646778.1 ABC transporter permease [Pontixanthobacter aestiaquae]MXO82240.1 ABC transporter permease [Pontixanthobacter aestiaquae]
MSNIAPKKSRLSIWRAAMVIARRDVRAVLFSKAFLLFLLGPLFFIGISVGAGLLGASASDSQASPKLAISLAANESDAFVEAHGALAKLVRLPDIEVVPEGEDLLPDALLTDGSKNFGAVLTGSLALPELTGTEGRINSWEGEVALVAARALGEPENYPEVALAPTSTSMAVKRSANSATATAAITLLFLLTMLLAGMVLSNLVEEKANKIIEILAAAIPMDAVFLGKLFAMLAVSFVGIGVWGSLGGAVMWIGSDGLPDIPAPAVGWPVFVALFLIYFAMAYLLIGSVFLAIGSMAPTVRDVQTLSMPATMLQLGVFFLATYAMKFPGEPIELFAVIFPVSSPYAMLARAAQDAALWPHLVALAWQGFAVALFVRAGSTLFKRKVMQSGPRGAKKSRKGFWRRRAT